MALDPSLLAASEAYLDRLFGLGAGAAHSRFLSRLGAPAIAEALHRAHAQQADEAALSVREHYLVGLGVLCATRAFGTAAMFAKTLRHLGVEQRAILEVVARLGTFAGPVVAAEAAQHVGRAIDEYEREGLASMRAWFPKE